MMKFLFKKVSIALLLVITAAVLFIDFKDANHSEDSIVYCIDKGNFPLVVKNDKKRVDEIQQQILKIYDKLLSSTVRIGIKKSGASGVLVSEDGYILTASHVILGLGEETKVKLNDGSVHMAKSLGYDTVLDYGLLKIETTDKLPFCEMGTASDLAKDEACVMFGHGGSDDVNRPAIVRLGFYKGVNDLDYLKTTCIMMPGDSGGPMFNLEGEVIGICSYISQGLDENFYPSIDNVKKNWDKLIKGGDVSNNEDASRRKNIKEASVKNKPYVLNGGKEVLQKTVFKNNNDIKKAVIKIKSFTENEVVNTKGTIINAKGYVVAKSSEVYDEKLTLTLYNNKEVEAKIVGRDQGNDIVLLKIKTNQKLNPISLLSNYNDNVGQIVVVVSDDKNTIKSGVIGLKTGRIKTSDMGFLGVSFSKQSENAIIGSTVEGKAAEVAGLLAEDEIISFNTIAINKMEDLLNLLDDTHSGQKIKLTLIRDSVEKEMDVVLGKKPNHKHHVAHRMETSERKDGFSNAFIHDIPIKIDDCGTPVVNLQGEVVGINIARRNRMSSLAIPLDYIEKTVKLILEKAESNS